MKQDRDNTAAILPVAVLLILGLLTGSAAGGIGERSTIPSRHLYDSATGAGELEAPRADDVEHLGSLTLTDALALATGRNPGLAALALESRALEAEIQQAGVLPNPELSFEMENFAGTGALGGFGASETTIAVAQLIQPGGKREKRRRIASLVHDQASWEFETYRFDVMTATAKAFIRVLTARRQHELAEDLVGVTQAMHESVDRRVRAGAVSAVEERRAALSLATSRVELNLAARRLETARARLASFWGGSSAGFTRVLGEMETISPPASWDVLETGLAMNPDLAGMTAKMELLSATAELEQANRIPDLTLGAGLKHYAESQDKAFVVELSVPLPITDRRQGARNAASSRLREGQQRLVAVQVRTQSELAAKHQELVTAFEETIALRESIIPEAEAAFGIAQDAYDKGLLSLTDVLDTQRTLFELQGTYFSSLSVYHTLQADIRRMTGESFDDLLGLEEDQ